MKKITPETLVADTTPSMGLGVLVSRLTNAEIKKKVEKAGE